MRMNMGRWERIGSVAAGAGLLYLTRRRSGVRRVGQALGAGLLARGVSGTCPVKEALVGDAYGRTDTKRQLGGDAGIHVRQTVVIRRPVGEVYGFWRDLTNLARFLDHVERVDVIDNRRSHWVVRGPGGMRLEWDAEILIDEPDTLLSWKSTAKADVVSAGSVTFRPIGCERTQVAVHFQYAPPGGSLGRQVAAIFGADPDVQVRDDLARLRELLEQRQDATAPASVSVGEGQHSR